MSSHCFFVFLWSCSFFEMQDCIQPLLYKMRLIILVIEHCINNLVPRAF